MRLLKDAGRKALQEAGPASRGAPGQNKGRPDGTALGQLPAANARLRPGGVSRQEGSTSYSCAFGLSSAFGLSPPLGPPRLPRSGILVMAEIFVAVPSAGLT